MSQMLKAEVGQGPESAPILKKLDKNTRMLAGELKREEARALTDLYYLLQNGRIRAAGQLRAITKESDDQIEGTTTPMLAFFFDQFVSLEGQIKRCLGAFAASKMPGAWMQSLYGVGDVISAGLLAHIKIERAPHAGNLMRFAGLTNDPWLGSDKARELVVELEALADDPKDIEELILLAQTRLRRQAGSIRKMMQSMFGDEEISEEDFKPTRADLIKTLALRPWNADLKCLAVFKLGESFVKTQNYDEDYYGHIFARRKALYTTYNAEGKFTEEAAKVLASKNINKKTDAYKAYSIGQLPKAHIHARARRYAVKLFLSHLH